MAMEKVLELHLNPNLKLEAILNLPQDADGLVLFAHGSGSSRYSPRNRYVAKILNEAGLASLLFDLLSPEEAIVDERTAVLRFNIDLLAERVVQVLDWTAEQEAVRALNIGIFGASTGAAAALKVAAHRINLVRAVVSRGGRPDLATNALGAVRAATLLIVGEKDRVVLELNQRAMQQLHSTKALEIVAGASHLFEEEGKLEIVAALAQNWFRKYLSNGAEPGLSSV